MAKLPLTDKTLGMYLRYLINQHENALDALRWIQTGLRERTVKGLVGEKPKPKRKVTSPFYGRKKR